MSRWGIPCFLFLNLYPDFSQKTSISALADLNLSSMSIYNLPDDQKPQARVFDTFSLIV